MSACPSGNWEQVCHLLAENGIFAYHAGWVGDPLEGR
jgi:hypothetical protein